MADKSRHGHGRDPLIQTPRAHTQHRDRAKGQENELKGRHDDEPLRQAPAIVCRVAQWGRGSTQPETHAEGQCVPQPTRNGPEARDLFDKMQTRKVA